MKESNTKKIKLDKTVGRFFLLLIIFILLILGACYINNRIQLRKEEAIYKPVGQQVTVNGHKMNVYTEGKGEKTLVFMSGSGTTSPVFDFMSLDSLLSESFKVVVVEKAGYGFSEDSNISRDIDTMLSETRQALNLARVQGPYVLCPHSMSGIEAIYWAQKYPQEVHAIIGLDMAVPETYESFKLNMFQINLGSLANSMGITRLLPEVSESEAMKYGTLTENEKKLCETLFYRGTLTKAMRNELRQAKENAKKVGKNGNTNVPVLIFSSNGSGSGWNEAEWCKFQKDYINKLDNGKFIALDCSHYVHNHEYEKIAREIIDYLKNTA